MSGLGGIWLTQQAMQPIERSFNKLEQFTADASHELRSPLMAIKANALVALKYPEGIRESDIEKFEAIRSAITQMTTLTEDLLLLARSDQNLVHERQIVNLASTLEQLMQLYQAQAAAKQISLTIQQDGKLYVLGNYMQLHRLFANLTDNALRYTPEGGKVVVKANIEGQYVYVSVQDTGIGLTPEQMEHVFERFWQADQARTYQSAGTGLGLAIAQSIALEHGGSLSVESEPGKGSNFTTYMPRFLDSIQSSEER